MTRVLRASVWRRRFAVTVRRGPKPTRRRRPPRPGRATRPDHIRRRQIAHDLYRGPLGEGLDPAWILSVREAARRTFLALTARLVRQYVATDPAAALETLEVARNLEPLNQGIYRGIIAPQLRLGDNDAAAATVRLMQSQLADFEESIDEATRALIEKVRI